MLDLAARYAPSLTLEGVHRFAGPEYGALSLRMRRGENATAVFDELAARGEVVIHATDVERQMALVARASRGELVVADTRSRWPASTGSLIRCGSRAERRPTVSGERVGVGDRIATRRNSADEDVANRETWTVTACTHGELTVVGDAGRRTISAEYVHQHVELAYATTAHGAQGSTVPIAHVIVGDHSGASSAYVGLTRGHSRNVAHLVAESVEDARQQWIDAFGRDRADLGPAHAAVRAAEEVERYGPRAARRRHREPESISQAEPSYRPGPSRAPGIGF